MGSFDEDFSDYARPTKAVDTSASDSGFDRDFSGYKRPTAGDSSAAPSGMEFSYSDIPVSQNINQNVAGKVDSDIGSGVAQGATNVAEGISKVELAALHKIGAISDDTYNVTKALKAGRLNEYNAKYGDNHAAQFGNVLGEVGASAPLLLAGGELAGAGSAALSDSVPALEVAGKYIQGNKLLNYAASGVKGATQGAGGNLLISGGSNDDLGDQAANGAKLGAALGVTAPAVFDAAKYVAKKGYNALSNLSATPEDYGSRKVLEKIGYDNLSPKELADKLQSMGSDATMVDAGGRNMLRYADTLGNVPGEAQDNIANALNARHAGQHDRILQASTEGLGIAPDVGYHGAVNDLIQQRSENAQPLYKKAFEAAPVSSDRINQFISDPVMKSGLNKGLNIQRLESLAEGKPFNPLDYGITGFNDAGDPIIGGVPNMRLLDAGKRGLDAIIGENTDQLTGKVNEMGRAVTKVKGSYLKELDNINPDYAAARSAYSEPSQSLDAVKSGNDFIKNGATGNVNELSKMSNEDKKFFRIGVGQAISDTLDNTNETSDAAKALMNKPKIQKALKSVFPSEEEYNNFAGKLRDEIKFFDTRRAILGGSPTQPRLSSLQDASQESAISASDLYNIAKGNHIGAGLNIATKAKNALSLLTPERASAASDIMFSPDQQGALNKLIDYANRRANSDAAISKFGQGAAGQFIGRNYIPITNIGSNKLLGKNKP